MTDEEYQQSLDGIGHYILNGRPPLAVASLLHVIMHDGWISFNLFDDLGTELVYRRSASQAPWELLEALHLGQPEERRWSELEYFLSGVNFNVKFLYPDEVGPERESLDVRDEVLTRYFGNKPVRYPPLTRMDGQPIFTGHPDGSWTTD